MKVNDIKKTDFFTLKEIAEPNESQVYIRGEYCRENKKYSCYKFNDVNYERLFDGSKEVYTGFTKKGVNFDLEYLPDLIEILGDVSNECDEKKLFEDFE